MAKLYRYNKVISWTVDHCRLCGRFLKKYRIKYCDRCKQEKATEQHREGNSRYKRTDKGKLSRHSRYIRLGR